MGLATRTGPGSAGTILTSNAASVTLVSALDVAGWDPKLGLANCVAIVWACGHVAPAGPVLPSGPGRRAGLALGLALDLCINPSCSSPAWAVLPGSVLLSKWPRILDAVGSMSCASQAWASLSHPTQTRPLHSWLAGSLQRRCDWPSNLCLAQTPLLAEGPRPMRGFGGAGSGMGTPCPATFHSHQLGPE